MFWSRPLAEWAGSSPGHGFRVAAAECVEHGVVCGADGFLEGFLPGPAGLLRFDLSCQTSG